MPRIIVTVMMMTIIMVVMYNNHGDATNDRKCQYHVYVKREY